MANNRKQFVSVKKQNDSRFPSKDLEDYSIDGILANPIDRTIWIDAMPYGNAYVNPMGAQYPHAEVFNDFDENTSDGAYSHTEGKGTQTSNAAEHAEGKYNKTIANAISSIGIGTSDSNRKNAMLVLNNGDIYIIGIGGYTGGDINGCKTVQEVLGGDTGYNPPQEPGNGDWIIFNLVKFDKLSEIQVAGILPSRTYYKYVSGGSSDSQSSYNGLTVAYNPGSQPISSIPDSAYIADGKYAMNICGREYGAPNGSNHAVTIKYERIWYEYKDGFAINEGRLEWEETEYNGSWETLILVDNEYNVGLNSPKTYYKYVNPESTFNTLTVDYKPPIYTDPSNISTSNYVDKGTFCTKYSAMIIQLEEDDPNYNPPYCVSARTQYKFRNGLIVSETLYPLYLDDSNGIDDNKPISPKPGFGNTDIKPMD